jgi:hypothetical protein
VDKTKEMGISRQTSPLQIVIDQKQLENVEYFNCLGSTITNDVKCTRVIKSRTAMAKAVFNKKKTFQHQIGLLRKKLAKRYSWCIALYGAENWTLRTLDQKYLESLEMWCCRRMEKISWTDRVRNEEASHSVKA